MERSRRVGVKSIYSRTNADSEQDKSDQSASEKSTSVVGSTTPRTTTSPRTTRSRGDTGSHTPSPTKRATAPAALDDAPAAPGTAKKRGPQSTSSPPAKRGRPPRRVSEQVPKEEELDVDQSKHEMVVATEVPEHNGEEEVVDEHAHEEAPQPPPTVPPHRTSSRRGNPAPPRLEQSAVLDEEQPVQHDEQMMEEMVEQAEGMEELNLGEDGTPPNLELCVRSTAADQQQLHEYHHSSHHRSLLGGAIARSRGRPINSRTGGAKMRAEGGRDVASQGGHVGGGSMMGGGEEEELEEDVVGDASAYVQPQHMQLNPRDSHRYLFNPEVLSDFYEPDMIVTEMGDKFLKAREGALPSLLKREMILSLIVNDTERAEQNDWVNQHSPAIPPLTTNVATYICFVDTKSIEDAKLLTTDGLSPWSSSHPLPHASMTPTRPKVRKWAVFMRGGEYCVSGEDWRMSLYVLVEYSALLPRAPRLRKRVYYMMRDRTLLGLAMLTYDYTEPGPIPNIISHSSARMYSRNRVDMVRFTDEEGNRSLLGIPVSADRPRISMSLIDPNDIYDDEDFDDVDNMDYIGGDGGMRESSEFDVQNGPFVGDLIQSTNRPPDNFIRVAKGNWTSDRSMLLKYLLNETHSIPQFAINPVKPSQPPLISTNGCFASFLKGSQIINQNSINTDALSPWTSQNCRPKTRKMAVEQTETGEYVVTRKDWRTSSLVLTEMCTTLARCPRLRKRIYYIMRNNLTVIGYALFMYEYMHEGDPPEIHISRMHPYKSVTRQRPIKFYDSRMLEKGMKIEGDLDDTLVDVMDVGEEVEVDLMEDDADVEELDVEEDESLDANEEGQWMESHYDAGPTDINSEVFEHNSRQTVLGDRYMLCRTRRLIGDKNLVLRYCVNDQQFAYEKGIVLSSKPFMPPLTSQMGIYVFFVGADNIDLRAVNKDGLSPWSVNDPSEMGKQMRSKVKKYAIVRDVDRGTMKEDGMPDEKDWRIAPGKDWHTSEVVLVQLHSTLPRCPRLQKKVFYVLDNTAQAVLGHVMIVYEYVEPGEAPAPAERTRRVNRRRDRLDEVYGRYEMDNVEDDGEIDKDSPFDFAAPGNSSDHCVYVPLIDPAFLMDRNRQLHYCVNRGYMLERHGLLNSTVPLFPPLIADKGDFVFFVAGENMDVRNLTCDGLAPWSDSRMPQATRPKSRKLPVEKSRDGVLRYVGGTRWEQTAYFLVVYYAVLPRCPRLKKRIIYACNQQSEIIGNVMIVYSYTEEGTIPTQVPHGNATTVLQPFYRMPPSLRDEAKRLLAEKRPGEVASVLNERSPSVTSRAIYNISKSLRPPQARRAQMYGIRTYKDEYDEWGMHEDDIVNATGIPRFLQPRPRNLARPQGPMPPLPGDDGPPGTGVHKAPPRYSAAADNVLRRRKNDDYDGYAAYDESGEPYIDVVADASIEVGHSEEIASSPMFASTSAGAGRRSRGGRRGLHRRMAGVDDVAGDSGRRDRILNFIQSQVGATGEEEALDYLWKLVVEKNERKVLDNIRRDFGVEIVTNDFEAVEGEELVETSEHGEVEEGVVQETETVVVDVAGGEQVVEETVEETVDSAAA